LDQLALLRSLASPLFLSLGCHFVTVFLFSRLRHRFFASPSLGGVVVRVAIASLGLSLPKSRTKQRLPRAMAQPSGKEGLAS